MTKPVLKAVCKQLTNPPHSIYCGFWDGKYHFAIRATEARKVVGWFPLDFTRAHMFNGVAERTIDRVSSELNR